MKKVKRPKSIIVLGQKIEIFYRDLTPESIWGLADVFNKVIIIQEGLDDEKHNKVLRHEVMHVLLGLGGLSCLLSDELEEAICTLIELD